MMPPQNSLELGCDAVLHTWTSKTIPFIIPSLSSLVSLSPIRILKREAGEEKSELARVSNFVGAFAIGDLVKSTLGPKGMDKILVSKGKNPGQVEITNDGATILKSIGIDNPAAKILVEMAVAEDDEVGDGTTSVTVLASQLLREAEELIEQKIHPQTIVRGWQIAVKIAEEALTSAAIDQSSNVALFRENLIKVASTTLSSKILFQHRDHFSKLAVDAVLRLKDSRNINAIQIIKIKGGVLEDSFLEEGLLLNKNTDWRQTQKIENANILIANTAMDADKIKVFGTKVKVDSTAELAELESAEKEKMSDKVAKILAHNINVFVNRQLIYNYPEQLFADAGVITIEHVDFEELERLALVTGGEILSTFDHPELVKLGHCDIIEPIMIGENTLLRFGGVPFEGACTIVIRGATEQIIDEAERSLHDALCVLVATLNEPLMIYGGGATEVTMANAIYLEAVHKSGKESLAMESFARALLHLPTTIADNGGYDSAQLISALKAAHSRGSKSFGLDMQKGEIGCMKKLGVLESLTVKRQILLSASEAAEMILRVDNIIRTPPTRPKDRKSS